MSKLIIYTSKKGCTEKCAKYIHENNPDSTILSLDEMKEDLNHYDEILLGTPIYMGMINKKMKQFIKDNETILQKKTLKVFLCGMNENEKAKVIESNFSESLIHHSVQIDFVGGAYDFNRLNFLQKFIIKKIANVTSSVEHINYDLLKKY